LRVVLTRHVVEDADYRHCPLAVQRRSRFVGKDHRRPVDQRPGDGYTLLLAAGKLRRHGTGAVRHLQCFKQMVRALARLGIGHAGQHGQQRNVVGHVQK